MQENWNYETEYDLYAKHFRELLKHRIKNDKTLTQTKIGKMMEKSQNAINNWLTDNKKISVPA